MDSVKNRDEQVIKAQRALFDEIVCNGNCVVLSLNQLVDSRMIMSMLNSEEYYDVLVYLFCNGYLKYSQYNDVHTPSQYLQKSIEDNRSFIYSALPVKSNQKYLFTWTIYLFSFIFLYTFFRDIVYDSNRKL